MHLVKQFDILALATGHGALGAALRAAALWVGGAHGGLLDVDGVGHGQMLAILACELILQIALCAITAQLKIMQIVVGHIGRQFWLGLPDFGHAAHQPEGGERQHQRQQQRHIINGAAPHPRAQRFARGGDAGVVDADVDDGSWFMAVGGRVPQAAGSSAASRRNGRPLAAGYRTVRARRRGRP